MHSFHAGSLLLLHIEQPLHLDYKVSLTMLPMNIQNELSFGISHTIVNFVASTILHKACTTTETITFVSQSQTCRSA